ncbi:YecA/YgfB family protein [Pasteurella sp. P03HT]|nr:hypothetical protein I926_07545 [Pasteurella multocida subsp. multocida OH4807]
MLSYSDVSQQLKTANIALSPAELHGFLSGLVCGGITDQSWQPLLFQFTNENHAYPTALLQQVTQLYQQISEKLADIDGFDFALLLPEDEEDIFARADSLSEWANHFLLGLGLAQPKLDKEKGDIGEALDDLHDICQLGYDENEDKEELSEALEEIIEYVRTIACLLFTHFQPQQTEHKPVLH